MTPNPILGVLFHAIGGLAAGSFYAPLKKVRGWAWESYWLVMGLAAWLITPWLVGYLTTPDLLGVLKDSPTESLVRIYVYGALWGIGGLTFGLTMRYLGIGLGMAVALGFCAVVGTLEPPIRGGQFMEKFSTPSGIVILAGLAVCVIGIGVCGMAGMMKEKELRTAGKTDPSNEFSLFKGLIIAVISGVLSACFAIGLSYGGPISELAIQRGTQTLYSNNAVLIVILTGGLTTNFLWCVALNLKNKTYRDYVSGGPTRLGLNVFLSALGGVLWYHQFFFYGMGQTKIGDKYEFSSWTLHMAFIIIFSSLWGMYFKEWRGTSRKTKATVWAGVLTLIGATVIVGLGNYLGAQSPPPL